MTKTFNEMVEYLQRSEWEVRRDMWYMDPVNNPYGPKRRENMLRVLAETEMPVNCRHALQTSTDPDLKYLIKYGMVKIVRRYLKGLYNPIVNRQYVTLSKDIKK